ncbi:unnamed protein product [Thlaspi arvense]|uniref:Photosystem I assembly protein Ycf4 n=1 Tax=Thlaspi arvense TaxID=13288 RepID=A0AAU9SBP7_THLAR|nr:unnamed protein product [Thlaspi arvense]
MTEADEMRNIENKWFGKQINSSDPTNVIESNRLGLACFWGLFLIAGIASFLAFLVFVALFLHEHWHTLRGVYGGSVWRKLTSLFRIFVEKDIKSHSFKNVSTPITQSPSSVEIRPWPRSMSLNREFELKRVTFVVSGERFKTQPKHDGELI